MLNLLAWLEDLGLSQNNHSWLHSSRQVKCCSVLSEQPTTRGKIRTATNPVVNRSPLGCQALGVRWIYDLQSFYRRYGHLLKCNAVTTAQKGAAHWLNCQKQCSHSPFVMLALGVIYLL